MLATAKAHGPDTGVRITVQEAPQMILNKTRQYLKSRWPMGQVPDDEEGFFAFALARLTQAPTAPLDPEVYENACKDHAEWIATQELPYYIHVWRDLSRKDILHFVG